MAYGKDESMPQITEDDGIISFHAQATLVYNMVEGVVKARATDQVVASFGPPVIESEGQNYVIVIGDNQFELNMDVQPFGAQGHRLSFERGPLSVNVYLKEENSTDFLNVLSKGSGSLSQINANIEINLKQIQGKSIVNSNKTNDMMMGRDDGSPSQMRNMGPLHYQITLPGFPYPLILRGAEEPIYHLDLNMGGLILSFELFPGEQKRLLKMLKSS